MGPALYPYFLMDDCLVGEKCSSQAGIGWVESNLFDLGENQAC